MTVEIEGVTLHLAHPDELSIQWVGQDELMRQLLAAWMVVNEQDLPMNPRLLGKPGVGKTTLAYAAGRRMGRDVYILQATLDTRPEDLLVTPVIEGGGNLRYVASPLVTAMIRGGIAIVDEGNRMSEKSWASLAPLLDNRRYVESIVAGIKIKAHPHFRLVATMNDDASTFELPEYIHSRLQPQIFIDFPERDEEYHILRENLPFAEERILSYVIDFLQMAHAADERYTVRDGINVARYAIKLKSLATQRTHETEALEIAVIQVLGEEALRYARRNRPSVPDRPDPGSLTRGRFTYFPVVPGRLEFAIEVRAGDPARPSRGDRPRTAGHLAAGLDARRFAPSRSLRHLLPGRDTPAKIRPFTFPSNPPTRSPRLSAPVSRSAPRSSSPTPTPAIARISRTLIRTRMRSATSAWRAISRPTASTRSRAPMTLTRHAAGIAWKLQGTNPLAKVLVVRLAQPARPRARRHGRAPGAAPGAYPSRRHRTDQSASRLSR